MGKLDTVLIWKWVAELMPGNPHSHPGMEAYFAQEPWGLIKP